MYRANATRVLCKITDSQMVQQIERYLKQEIVDRNPVVASAALVSGQQLISSNKGDVVRRWTNEISQALEHRSPMVQYHALALLYQIRQFDRLAVSKLVQSVTRSVRTPMASVLLIRYVARIIAEDDSHTLGQGRGPYYDFLMSSIRHHSDIVIYEAARAIAGLPGVTDSELESAISVLQLLLVQPKPALRFAAIRTLHKIASTNPLAASSCNADMEVLIGDSNRSISTLAITTLLRTGSEGSIERLLKQIQSFMGDIADEFKVSVVDAIHALCLKYPAKHYALMNFLGNALREEGGFKFKAAIVSAYLALMESIPSAKETCLGHLCEFIEDCEHALLSTQILHLLGKEGPHMPNPGKYIRYIYNRLMLENSTVRAAAVSALARFAGPTSIPKLRRSVGALLTQSLMDSDDEVRDRASYFTRALELDVSDIESDLDESEEALEKVSKNAQEVEDVLTLECPIYNLEAELLRYVSAGDTEEEFDIKAVPKVSMSNEPEVTQRASAVSASDSAPGVIKTEKPADLSANVMAVPEFVEYGRPFKSCKPVDLTEAETEYTASVVKHIYKDHLILEFIVNNTLSDQLLENVTVHVDTGDASGLGDMTLIPIVKLSYGNPGRTYTCIRRTDDGEYPLGRVECVLKYTVKELDPSTGEPDEEGVEDEYPLDSFDMSIGDLMGRPGELPSNFKNAWDALGADNEMADEFALDHDGIQSAIDAVVEFLGMAPCEGTEKASERARSHILLLAGIFIPGFQVLMRVHIVPTADGVGVNILVRSEDQGVSELVAGSIA
eukprot:Plantae.Rhodophyta-Hildenbrandia_rubra.ctg4234.p1 GENE.Plantae.Rhodophyta-Hildenbrandia_rubra.ctg4234~~Plantae.Rhodophyta-Hildenbrandia_rubra.ctg4234.p1  ORF type:complete len:786 (+),score=154.13 Plantae.Rhodophyta-Hildenbrandia_rubra.ctg4234:2586-4943(+)